MVFIGAAQFIDSSWGPKWLGGVGTLFSVLVVVLLLLMWKMDKNQSQVPADGAK